MVFKKILVSGVVSLFFVNTMYAQVKIGDNPNTIQPSSLLELESTNKGVLIPRMTTAQRNAISAAGGFNSAASNGLIIFNSDDNKFYFWNSTTSAWELVGGTNQSLSINGSNLSISGGNTITLPTGSDNQTLTLVGNNLSIQNANSVDLSPYLDNTDAQNLGLSGTDLSITGGNTVSLASFINTDNQDLALAGNTLSLTNDGTTVDLSGYLDNTDAQTLGLSGTDLTISGGNTVSLASFINTDNQDLALAGNTLSLTNDGTTVDLSGYLDNTDAQTLGLSGTDLTISGGNTVSLASFINTDNQDLALAGNTLSLTNDGTTVDLSGYLDNTDAQTLGLSGTDLTISGGNTVSLASFINTDNQDLSLAGNTLSLTNDGTTVDLSGYLDNTDAQTLGLSGTDLTISGGNTVSLASFINTDNQDLSLAGNTLSLTNDGTTVDLSGYLDNTDAQTLSLAANVLSISGGNNVNLAAYLDNTDNQDLALAGNTLSLTNDGTTVDLSGYLDNTDAQTLSLVAGNLTISNGNTVSLSAFTNTDNQDLSLAGNTLSLTNDGTTVDLSGYLDNTDAQTLALAANVLSISGGNNVNLASYLDNTDAQTLTLAGNNLTISGGNTVSLAGFVNTDNQDLSLAGNTLSLTNDGTTVDLSGYLDNTDAQTLSYAAGTLTISGGNSVTLTGLGDNLGNHIATMPITTTVTAGNIIQIGDDAHITDVNDANYIGINGIQSGGNIAGIRFGSTAFPNNPRIYGTATTMDFITNATTRMSILAGGNVGVGTTTPAEKFHVADAGSPNTATIRVSGLSSTSTLTSNATDAFVMADANGSLRRANETVKDAWYTTGNATTAVRNIGTTSNFGYQFIANNIVRGRVNPTDGELVWGGAAASPYAGDALCAVANATTTFAVNGYSAQNGSGVWGEILAAGTTNFSAVQGVYAGTGTGGGVLGNYNGTNTTNTRAGVIGVNGTIAAGGAAVRGSHTGASGNQHMGVLGQYSATAFGIGVYGLGFGGGLITGNNDVAVVGWRANNNDYSGYFNGNHVIANGTKSASVPTSKGNQLLYCMESPEVWFEDFGVAYLVDGKAEVKLDELFLETVLIDDEHPMHVFIQVQGECNDVYVTTGTTSFTVVEKEQGKSNVKFSYRLVAKRAMFPDHRFGNDPVWKDGDTRPYSERAPKRPIDYNEAVKQQEEMKKNWKPTSNPAIVYPDAITPNTERDPETRNKEQK